MRCKGIITDWIPFENPSVFETMYRRVGNRVEVSASWAEATGLYEHTLPKSVEQDLELHKIESIWPRGLSIRLDSTRKNTPRVGIMINPFIGPRYIKTVEWGSDAEVVGRSPKLDSKATREESEQVYRRVIVVWSET